MAITQELVRFLFDYKDGFLYWKNKTSNKSRVIIGERAGMIGAHGRNIIGIYGRNTLQSRLIFIYHHGWLPEIVDHENRIKSDDRIENLRAATSSQNNKNKKSRLGSASKYLGVHQEGRKTKYWRVKIRTNNGRLNVGCFKNEADAALAYNRAAVMHHGEFANLNIIQKPIQSYQ